MGNEHTRLVELTERPTFRFGRREGIPWGIVLWRGWSGAGYVPDDNRRAFAAGALYVLSDVEPSDDDRNAPAFGEGFDAAMAATHAAQRGRLPTRVRRRGNHRPDATPERALGNAVLLDAHLRATTAVALDDLYGRLP